MHSDYRYGSGKKSDLNRSVTFNNQIRVREF